MHNDMNILERLVVFWRLTRLAWETTRGGYPTKWTEGGTKGGPGASFVTISPSDADASALNPVYGCNPERVAFQIDVMTVNVTKPGDTAACYEEGEYGFYFLGYARPGSRRKVTRLTAGDSTARAAIRAAKSKASA